MTRSVLYEAQELQRCLLRLSPEKKEFGIRWSVANQFAVKLYLTRARQFYVEIGCCKTCLEQCKARRCISRQGLGETRGDSWTHCAIECLSFPWKCPTVKASARPCTTWLRQCFSQRLTLIFGSDAFRFNSDIPVRRVLQLEAAHGTECSWNYHSLQNHSLLILFAVIQSKFNFFYRR